MTDTYQVLPPLSDEQFSALKADIAENGVLVPVEYDEDGNILDGFHRVKACRELGVEDWPSLKRLGLTEKEKRTHARRLNMNRRHLSRKQKREQIEAQLKDTPKWSNRRIAQLLGVSPHTVIDTREEMENEGELCNLHSLEGADGKERPAQMPGQEEKKSSQGALFTSDGESAKRVQKVIDKSKNDSEISEEARRQIDKLGKMETTPQEAADAVDKARTQQAIDQTALSSESNEYYTPPEYIEATRNLFGTIDLDPASHPKAQEYIKAETYFTEEDDGLSQDWHGKIWLNPPYGKIGNKSSQGHWAQYLKTQYEAEHVTEAVLLVKAAVGYNWFEALWDIWPVCFARERLSFVKSDGDDRGQSKQGTALFYLGDNIEGFIETFTPFGRIILPEDQR